MAINKKLIHFLSKTNFEERLVAGDILDTSIVFIQDAKQIYTHGQLYSCPFTEEELKQLFVGSTITLQDYIAIDSPISITATDTVNEAFGKIEEYLNSLSELNAVLVDTEDVASDPAINDYISPTELDSILMNYATEEWVESHNYVTNSVLESKGYLTEHQDISNLAPKAEAISNITRSDNTFTATKADGTTFTFDLITYSADNSITLSDTTFGLTSGIVTAGTVGPTADVTGTEGTTISIPSITVDTYGRVTGLTSYTLTNKYRTYSAATTSANGLMSSTDKSRFDFIHSSSSVTTLASLPAKAVVNATLSAATTISLASALTVGQSITVICTPSASFTQPIPTSGSFISMDGDSLSVTSGVVFEINILCYASGKYSISCKTAA